LRVKHFSRIFSYIRPYRRLAVSTVCILLFAGLFGLTGPWPMKILIDNVLDTKPLPHVLEKLAAPLKDSKGAMIAALVSVMVLITIIENVLSVINNYVTTKLDQKMVLDFRGDLFRHAQRLSLAFHDQKRSGPLIYAINFQADAAAGIVLAVPPLLESLLTLVGMLIITFLIDWRLALLSLAVVPPLFYSIRFYANHIEERLRKVKELEEVSLSIIHEAISMLRVIVAFGREDYEFKRFRRQGETAVDARVALTVRQTLFTLAVKLITGIGIAAVLGVGAVEVSHQRVTLGQLLVIMAYIAMVYKPLEAISYTLGSLQNNFVNMEMASELLEIQPEIQDKPGAIDIARARGEVEFRDICFSYTGRQDTLADISLKASAGEVVAIVGPTGAGKTTLVSLIARFYAPSGGQILLDGRDVNDISIKSLRDQISMVLQEPMLSSGTVADNIRYGRLDATTDEIIKAAQAANAHEFITRLPQQYETQIGERGAQLSGGERQRICVARAFLKDAPILILDEPTSSIDSKTEAVILDALDLLMEGRTTFMIAHRLSTVRKADKILVMDQGRLAEQGTHDELIRLGGLYKQLHDLQGGQQQRRRTRILAVGAAE
jgi:ATP-binding cassette subfamily B protein